MEDLILKKGWKEDFHFKLNKSLHGHLKEFKEREKTLDRTWNTIQRINYELKFKYLKKYE